MKYFLDTEFIENGRNNAIILLSLAIVREDGREMYVESPYARDHEYMANEWVRENVLPHMTGPVLGYAEIKHLILEFVKGDPAPEFWGYYCDYDWVVFCQLFGAMIDLPKDWPMFCMDLKQWAVHLGVDQELPVQETTEHHALNDARWNRTVWEFLDGQANK